MNNRFEEVMSKKTNEALRYILDAPEGTYQAEALTAAKQEWEKRSMAESVSTGINDLTTETPLSTNQGSTASYRPVEPQPSEDLHTDVPPEINPDFVHVTGTRSSEQERYPALRIIAGFYNVLAWLVVVAVVLGLAAMAAMEILTWWRIAALIVGGGLLFVSLLALSEVIKLFIDMEKNTRRGV